MKKLLLLLLVCGLFSINLDAQENNLNSKSRAIPCSGFGITKPLSELFANFNADAVEYENEESEDRKHRNPTKYKFHPEDGYQYANDSTVIQHSMGTIPGKTPLTNWPGQTASGFRPYDPSGAAGPSHYVQMINSTTFRIYNKTSGAIILTGTLGNLWSPATGNNGDPIVMYDKAANRWFLAQFGNSSDKKIYIAISTTSDPTGSYYTYTYTSPSFPDYLKFGVWHDGYYMTSNQPQKVFAFNRTAMLAGSPTASSLYVSFSPPQGGGFFCPLPADAGDGTLPTSGPCPILSYSDNGWGGSNTDAIQIYNMSVNWTTTTGSISYVGGVPTAAFDAQYNSNWDDCPQPGTTQKLDGIGGILMYRAQWKSWSGYNTLVLNWAVHISSTQRSIMWCELRQNQSSGVWSMYQQGIYTPDASTRWMGSIAMDNNGSIGMAYLKSNATSIYPTLCYTGRTAADPLGTFSIAEVVVATGTSFQTGTNRIGDYAHTALDPDGITFWHTGEYFGGVTGAPAKTQIFSWQISPGSVASVNIMLTSGSNPSCSGSPLTFTATPTNGGTAPVYQWKVNGANVGTNTSTYSTNTLANGDIVSCVLTSNLVGVVGSPATSNALTMGVITSTTPTISISAGSNNICLGTNVVFTANITNGGTSPAYQWKVDGVNVGTNSSTFTSSTLTNGQVVTCMLISNAVCANPATATSNAVTMTVNSTVTPAITISSTSTNICSGSSVTFTATTANGGTPSFQWKVNGANVGTNSSTFTSSTLTNGQIVTCVMTSNAACSNPTTATSNAVTMTVNSMVTPLISISSTSTNICNGSSVTFTATTANGGTPSFQWKVNGGNVGTNSSTFTSSTLNNNDVVTCQLTSNLVCVSAATVISNSITMVVTSLITPAVSISGNTTACIGSNVTFTATPTNGGTPSYQWKLNGSNVGTNSNTYSNSGLLTGQVVSCVMTSSLNCTTSPSATSNNLTMTMNANVTPTLTISAGATTICSGTPVTFTASGVNGGIPVYQWKLNGNNVGINSATYTNATLANGDIVSCTMQSGLSCTTVNPAISNAITMTVNNTITPSVSIFLSSGSNPTCIGNTLTFTATASNAGISPVYQWQVNGTNVGTNSNTFTTSALNNNDAVKCIITTNVACQNSGSTNSNIINMVVNSIPVVSAGTYPNPCTGQLVSLFGTPSGGSFSGTGVSGNTFTSSSTGVFTITYSYSSPGGCSNSATTNITVLPCQVNLLVKAFIQGYYLGNSTMTTTLFNQGVDPNLSTNVTDTVDIELRQAFAPFSLAFSYKGTLKTDGTINCSYPMAAYGNMYYIVLKHRNTIETWSSTPVTVTGSTIYDFSSAATQAFNQNEILLSPNVWGMYSGDINQDMTIDIFDHILEYMDIQNGGSGYLVTDLNGDGSVDAFDFLLMYPNLYNGITAQTP